jgi:hypothetical protein
MKNTNKKTKVAKAVKTLTKALKKDPSFFNAYQANIAMQFKDEYARKRKLKTSGYMNSKDVHIVANRAAEAFLNLLIKS